MSYTTRTCAAFNVAAPATPQHSADFVIEAPQYENPATQTYEATPIPRFTPITFTRNQWDMDTRGRPVHAIQYWATKQNLTGITGNLLATTGPMNPKTGDFTLTYRATR